MLNIYKTKNGFTIIELMVVVAIIGIISLIGLRLYLGQQEKAKDAIVKGNASTIHTLIQSELADNNASDIDEAFLNQVVINGGIHNPVNGAQQISSYYSSPDKSGNKIPGMIYVWKDNEDIFHVNGWNSSGNDVLQTDLIAIK
jgi:prepilin-type N-terminal cleavage/methylation domain-containing protein